MSDDDPSAVSVAYTEDQFSDAIAEAQAAGDNARANELYVAQLAKMEAAESPEDGSAGGVDDEPENLIDSDDEVESSDESLSLDDPFVEYEPVSVEQTDAVYSQFRDEFEDAHGAAALQNAWGDSAVAQDAIIGQLLNASPEIGALYEAHQTDAGGLSLEGVSAATQYLMDNSSYETPEALNAAHPELEHLYLDHSDTSGNLSPAGVKIILAYIAGKSGFEHNHKVKRT